MANHKSAAKRARQTKRKTTRNSSLKAALKTFEKKVRTAYTKKDPKEALKALKTLVSEIDKAANKGVVHARNAARKVSRLSKMVNKIGK